MSSLIWKKDQKSGLYCVWVCVCSIELFTHGFAFHRQFKNNFHVCAIVLSAF